MTSRFCPTCGAEVTDAGGYCLLGHSLRLQPPVESLAELRSEVDRAFEAARRQLAQVIAEGPGAPAGEHAQAPPATNGGQPVVGSPAVGAPVRRVPPPPPPPPARRDVFSRLEDESPASTSDPITAFAPPARMDWGPERSGLRKRSRHDR